MISGTFTVDGLALGRFTYSNNDEENEGIFAPRLIQSIWENAGVRTQSSLKLDGRMAVVMHLLPKVAHFYRLDKDKILQNWTSEFSSFNVSLMKVE